MILRIALIISIFTYMFWGFLPKGSFYVGNALFIFLLCVYLFKKDKKSFIKFCLLCLSLSNLLDEIFFDNTKIGINEFIMALSMPFLWILRKCYDGKNNPK